MKIKNKLFYPVLALTLICLVVSALLAVTNSLTADAIAKQNEEAIAELRAKVLPADEYITLSGTAAKAQKDGKTIGYVFSESAKGYGGDVSVVVGISSDGKITGVQVVSHSETPGKGDILSDSEFLALFEGRDTELKDGEIKKTGASITSKALSDAVNKAIEEFRDTEGGEAK